jgi:hypothetical protein
MANQTPKTPRSIVRALPWLALLTAAASQSGCYYHAMGGPAVATANDDRVGAVLTASTGLNGQLGGIGFNASGTLLEEQFTGMLGVEALRLWRGEAQTGFQPYLRGALGLVEVGRFEDETLLGGLSPRAEAGVMWLDQSLQGLTLGAAAEYRLRDDGLSTPIFWLQVGFGVFDYVDSPADRNRRPPARP